MHWDFALILTFLTLVVPVLGWRRVRQLAQAPDTTKRERIGLYLSTIAAQWLAVAFILWRAKVHGIPAVQLGIAIPNGALVAATSILLAALFLVNQLLSLRQLAADPVGIKRNILARIALLIFPRDLTERLIFTGMVVTVAICEELIYRGFVQRIFENWSGVFYGAVGSAALFSLGHIYQGRHGAVSTFVVGLIFSASLVWTGSLLPSFVAHFVADITVGLLAHSRLSQTMAHASDPGLP